MQALHRVRERLIGARTALINEVHGLMHEYGIVLPKGVSKFRQAVVDKLESEQEKLTALSQEMFGKLVAEFGELEKRLAYYQEKLEALATTHPECQRPRQSPPSSPSRPSRPARVAPAAAVQRPALTAQGWRGWRSPRWRRRMCSREKWLYISYTHSYSQSRHTTFSLDGSGLSIIGDPSSL
jgi:hypothetical protein